MSWAKILISMLLALLLAAPAQAQREGREALAAEDFTTDYDIIYRLSDEYSYSFRDTVTVEFSIVQRDALPINRIDVTFYWLDAEFDYLAARRGSGWPDTSLAFSPTHTDTSLFFMRDGFTFVFDSTKPVIEVDFVVDCVTQGGSGDISFEFNTSSRPLDNWFHRGTTPYWPGAAHDATVEHDGTWPNKESAKIEIVGDYVIEIGDTVETEALITAPFDPWGGVWTLWTWTSRLDFVGIDTAMMLFSGLDFTATVRNDSLWVYTADSFNVTGTQPLFIAKFVSTATSDDVKDTVFLRKDSVFSGCDFMEDGDADNDRTTATIPEYTATIDIVDRSIYKTETQPVTVRLQNNFTVDMTRTHPDSCAAFNPDEDPWNLITWAHQISELYDPGEGVYRWKPWDAGSDTSAVREDALAESNSIPKSTSYQNIAWFKVTAGTTAGSDTVGFYRVDDTSSAWQRDSKLRSYNAPIMIYSHSDGVDSLFKLQSGIVTVMSSGGGGSCPFLMSWNGSRFVDENTILTQTEFNAEGVSVADFYRLAVPPATADGAYRLRIEERADEVSYIDNVRLLRFDVDPGQELNVTPDGQFFFAEKMIQPVAAVDHLGADVLRFVSDRDGNFYASRETGWLVVTYEIDRTESGRVFVGHAMAAKGDPCDQDGPGGPKVAVGGPQLRDVEDSPIELEIAARVDGGSWKPLAQTPPRDFTAPTFTAAGLRLREGGRVEVRYTWTERWEADQLPLIIASSEVPEGRELLPLSAIHAVAGKTTDLVTREDQEFTVLKKGEALDLSFPIGGRVFGDRNQIFVVAATGYYVPAPAADLVLPGEFALEQNYPNPFNAETRIDFAVAMSTRVVLEVINVLGQRVVTLVDRELEAGQHHVDWDGRNDQGSAVASGTYFVRMNAADFEQKRAMTLLK